MLQSDTVDLSPARLVQGAATKKPCQLKNNSSIWWTTDCKTDTNVVAENYSNNQITIGVELERVKVRAQKPKLEVKITVYTPYALAGLYLSQKLKALF